MNIYQLHSNPEQLVKFEEILTKKLHWAYNMAKSNKNLRIYLEPIIAKNAYYSYNYATCVLNNFFPLGEDAIATDPKLSLWYALHVNDTPKRFIKGEKAISKSPSYAFDYAEMVIKGEWPMGEDAIATNSKLSFNYAMVITGKRFLKGEPVILKDDFYNSIYTRAFLKTQNS